MIECENGEYILETQLFDNPLRYLIGDDKIFIINKVAYKVLDSGFAIVPAENSSILNNIESFSNLDYNNVCFVPYYDEKYDLFLKDNANICYDPEDTDNSRYAHDDEDNGRNRTHLRISLYAEPIMVTVGSGPDQVLVRVGTSAICGYMVRPYMRTIGVWYWCTRTISYNLQIAVDAFVSNNWTRKTFSKSEYSILDSKREDIFNVDNYNSMNDNIIINYHFGGYDCWASTPSTSQARLNCNLHLTK